MVDNRRGIPNTYNSQRFRSLVEARWASFFDEVGWDWEYEPFELKGYIPDFVLKFSEPVLVEVKYELTLEKLEPHAAKIAASGWDGESLIVGASLFRSKASSSGLPGTAIGLLGHAHCREEVRDAYDPNKRSLSSMDSAIFSHCDGLDYGRRTEEELEIEKDERAAGNDPAPRWKDHEFTINQEWLDYGCRRHYSRPDSHNHWKYLKAVSFEDAVQIWRTATNRVQWNRR